MSPQKIRDSVEIDCPYSPLKQSQSRRPNNSRRLIRSGEARMAFVDRPLVQQQQKDVPREKEAMQTQALGQSLTNSKVIRSLAPTFTRELKVGKR